MMVEDKKKRRRSLADRILEENGKKRKGLADRIRESGSATRDRLDESAEVLSTSGFIHPKASIDEKRPVQPATTSEDGYSTKEAKVSVDQIPEFQGFINFRYLKVKALGWAKAIKAGISLLNVFKSRKRRGMPLHSDNGVDLKNSTRKAYGYAEAHRLREKITNELEKNNQKTVVIISPHDGAGNTFLTSVLALNAVSFSNMEVLVVDMNMRKPQLHMAFDLQQEPGFTDVVKGSMEWKEVIKNTDLEQLKIITAGQFDMELARHLNRPNLENIINKVKKKFDLVLLDTSPILSQNRNNVDPALLGIICDMVLLEVQGKMTTKSELDEAFEAIIQGGGKVNGIIYNQRFGELF